MSLALILLKSAAVGAAVFVSPIAVVVALAKHHFGQAVETDEEEGFWRARWLP